MNCRYCHDPLPEDSPPNKSFCNASHKVMFSRNGAKPKAPDGRPLRDTFPKQGKTDRDDALILARHVYKVQSTESKSMPTIPKKIPKPTSVKISPVEDEDDLPTAEHAPIKVLKKVAIGKTISKPSFTGPRQWPTDITLGEVKNRLKGIRNYLEWATGQGLRGQVATRQWVEGLLAQAGQPASLADLVFGPKQKEEEEDNIPG